MPVHDPRNGNDRLLAHCEHCRLVVIIPFKQVLRSCMPWRVRLRQVVPKLVCSKSRNRPRSVEVQKKEIHGQYGHAR